MQARLGDRIESLGVGDVLAVPGEQIVDAVDRGHGHMDGIGHGDLRDGMTLDQRLGESATSSVKYSKKWA